ncbi:MAG: cation diffusion facilitator family transporter [Muribaculaceae bacterium]|nr:cation diffusion facilitator family transporter [Muribaculaceae bacterium]
MKHEIDERKLSDILPDEGESSARAIRRVVKIGCVVNALLMCLKLCAGYFGHSDALVADGFHSLNDLAADIIMLVFVGISYKAADSKYSFGYGKFETFSSFLISTFLIIVAYTIAYEAVESIVDYFKGEELAQPDIWTVIVVLVAMACKEGLFRFYSYSGKKENCQALVVNAWHHRSDAFASIATLIGVSFSHFFGPAFRILDPIASFVIAIFILIPATRLFRPAFRELMERSLPAADVDKAITTTEGVAGVEGIDYIRTRRVGHHLVFDLGIKVSPTLTVPQGEAIANNVKAALQQAFCRHIITTVSLTTK